MRCVIGSGSGSGPGSGEGGQGAPIAPEAIGQMRPDEMDDRIREILHDEVAAMFWSEFPEMFGSIKTAMVEYFVDGYATLSEAAATAATIAVSTIGLGAGQVFQYQDFDNMNPLTFDGTQDPIKAMSWLADMEGCFFTCLCPTDQKDRCALNLLRSGAKDWWRLMIGSYSDEHRAVVTWDQFWDIFHARYIPRVEREWLAQEFLELRKDQETVMDITRMFTERAMFCPKFASEQAQMTRYMSMLKTDICQFVATQRCDTLLELQEAAR
ncbi:uncharacterized protein LOC128133384 [Lactuca sativa]|uniref:uncharacterized protein LOC128133384 n=1 Tax=Lactuca sativa TaxID=4236 RepID=UPI0022AF3D75|nr:uncharacterized protein LOC128133384 [Lactuca sativa]